MTVYNNDLGTFFVFILFLLPSLLCCNEKIRIGYVVILAFLFYNDIEQFRWFQTEYQQRTLVIDQIYTHDTRETHSFVDWNEDGLDVKNVYTGSLLYYMSTVGDCVKGCSNPKELFTISNRIYPHVKGYYKYGDTIKVCIWRYTYSPLFEIKSFT